jgi:hypothetical protein
MVLRIFDNAEGGETDADKSSYCGERSVPKRRELIQREIVIEIDNHRLVGKSKDR